MAGTSPFRIELSDEERRVLKATAGKYSSPYRDVVRAKIVLYASEGLSNAEIAGRLDLPRQIVSKWRKRFFDQRLGGLEDAPRPGKPRVFSPTGGHAGEGHRLRAAESP
jgi:transposase-like protein